MCFLYSFTHKNVYIYYEMKKLLSFVYFQVHILMYNKTIPL